MKHQIRKVASLLLALTMILSTMPLASATMVASVIKAAALEPNNTADIHYSAVGEALVVREDVYDDSNIWQPSRVVYEAEDGSFQLSEALSDTLSGALWEYGDLYGRGNGYDIPNYLFNRQKCVNIKTGEISDLDDSILDNKEEPMIHYAYSESAGGYRYYRGTYSEVRSTADDERELAFEGVFGDAGHFTTDSNYARVTSREQVQGQAAPATTVTQNVYQIINKSGEVVYSDVGSGVLATHYMWSEFHNDMLLVTEPDTYQKGYMDETGTLVIPCVYADAYDFHNGYARVDSGHYSDENEGRSMSLIDTSGNTIIPEGTYDVITDVDSDGMLWAVRDDTVYHLRIVAPSSGGGGGGSAGTTDTVKAPLSGGGANVVGTPSNAVLGGTIAAANASAGTADIGGTSLTYSSSFNDVKLDSEVVGQYAKIYLDTAGKIAGYRLFADGTVTGFSNDGGVMVGGANYYYHSSVEADDRIPSAALDRRCELALDGDGKIRAWYVDGTGSTQSGRGYVTSASDAKFELRYDWETQNTTTYEYADTFSGVKLDEEDINRWISILQLNSHGEVIDYYFSDYGTVVSANNSSVTLTPGGGGDNITYYYSGSFYDDRLTAETITKHVGLDLNGSRQIISYYLSDYGIITAADSSSGTITIRDKYASGDVETSYMYADNFDGAKVGAEHIGQQINIEMDGSGKIKLYAISLDDDVLNEGTCGDNAKWTLFSSGTLTISGTGAMADYDNLAAGDENRAPWYSYASDIKRVVIRNGITRIGSCAFDQCINLADVSIPDTVTTIGNNSFQNCRSLTSIDFPNGLKTIERYAFWSSGLTSVTVPDSVTTIGISVFSDCQSLTSISLGNGITEIDGSLVEDDYALKRFEIPRNVTEIVFRGPSLYANTGIQEFTVAKENTAFAAVDGVLYSGDKSTLVAYPPKAGGKSFLIPDDVTRAPLDAFYGSQLSEIRIPSGTAVSNEIADKAVEVSINGVPAVQSDTNIKLFFEGDIPSGIENWGYITQDWKLGGVVAEHWDYNRTERPLSNAVLYVPYYANTVSTIDDDPLDPPFYASGLAGTGLELDETGGFVTGAPLATGKTAFTVSSGAKTYTFSVTTRENNTTTVTAETSEDLVIEKTVSNMTTSTVSDQVFEIEDKDKDETTEVKSNFEKFLDVYLDGVKLVGGKIEPSSTDPDAIKSVADVPDDWEYYAEEGSTKITVRAQTFQNKSSGTHTIAATFEKTVVDPVTKVETREVITAAQNFAITTSDGGGNGGGGGGGGSSTGTVQQPAVETKTPELSYSVTDGVAALDSTSVTQMAASATEQKSDTLTLDLTNGNETVTAVSLPAGLMDQIAQLAASGENSVDSLAIVLTSGSLELDAETLSEIAQQAGGESISMALEEVSADQLSDGQKAALEELSAEKIISIEISCADKQITDFGGGRVNLSIPFTAAADKNARGYAVWHLADDGKTSRHSTGYADGKISFRTAHFSNYAVAYREPNLFTDVLDGLWYTNDVDHVAALGIMNGVSGTKFAPNTALTRAMFAQIIYNAENGTAGAPSSFSDVPDGMWYTDAVNWAAQNRIVSGIGNSQYAPDREITREELVMMLYNYATYKGYDAKTDVELTRFSDSSSVSTWAETAMKWAVRNKLINGVGEKLLAGDKATRAQVAKVMAYFLEQYAR